MTEQQVLERVEGLYNLWEQGNESCSIDMFLSWVEDKIKE